MAGRPWLAQLAIITAVAPDSPASTPHVFSPFIVISTSSIIRTCSRAGTGTAHNSMT